MKLSSGQTRQLLELLSIPTAPFRESLVLSFLKDELDKGGVPHCTDKCGNLVAGVSSLNEYRKLLASKHKSPLLVFIAHTDHPGFHGKRWLDRHRLAFEWHGGGPVEKIQNQKMWVSQGSSEIDEATLVSYELTKSKRAITKGVLRFHPRSPFIGLPAEKLFGGYGFGRPAWRQGSLVYTKAADDLIGTYSILQAALAQFRGGRRPKNFIGLFTRAEEVGFVGTLAHFNEGYFEKARRPLLFVSLEASRTLPGAEIGKGPVIRLGDRSSVFDPGALRVFTLMAEKKLKGRHQRRIMDGGTCEASVAVANGFPAIGVSVPLGNYHNQNFEGAPGVGRSKGAAPEFVHLNDIAGQVLMCRELLSNEIPWGDPWSSRRKDLSKLLARYEAFL